MSWSAVHPDMTTEVRIPDEDGAPVFTLGFWPPLVAERLGALIAFVRKPRDLDPIADLPAFVKASGLELAAFQDMVRYGVRGWTGWGDLKAVLVPETFDGREHKRLTEDGVVALHANKLLVAVALKAMLFNILTEEEKKTSDWQSGRSSRSRDTVVLDASPPAAQSTTGLPRSS